MWYGHKARERGSTQDSMVLRRPIHHLELDPFSSIVIFSSEDDIEADLPKRDFRFARNDSMEGCVCSFDVGQGYIHGPQSGGEDEFEAAASIHEDFAHVESSNLSFEHQQGVSASWNSGWMIFSIEANVLF